MPEAGIVIVRHANGYTQVFGPFDDPVEMGVKVHAAVHERYGGCDGVDTWVSELAEWEDASSLPPASSQLDDPDLVEHLAGIADTVREVASTLGLPVPPEIGWQSVEALLAMRKRWQDGAFQDGADDRVTTYQASELRRYRRALMDLARMADPDEGDAGNPMAFEIATRALRSEDTPWGDEEDS